MNSESSNTLPFQAAFQHAPLGMFLSDADGVIVAVNDALVGHIQQPAATLIGNPWHAFFMPFTPANTSPPSADPKQTHDNSDHHTVNNRNHPATHHLTATYHGSPTHSDTTSRNLQGHYQLRTPSPQPYIWQLTTNYLAEDAVYITTVVRVSQQRHIAYEAGHVDGENVSGENVSGEEQSNALRDTSDTERDIPPDAKASKGAAADTTQTRYDRDHLRALYDVIPDGILYFDREGICTDVKQPTTFTTYRPYTGIVGKHISSDLAADDGIRARAALAALFSSGKTQYFEHTICIDGDTYYRENRFVKINDQAGLALVRDVSARKRTEQALRDSESLFRSFFEDNPVPCLLVLDEDAYNQANTFILNRAYYDFLGCSEDDISGMTLGQFIAQFMHPEDIEREQPLIDEVSNGTRSSYRIEKRYLRPDGSLRWGVLNNLIVHDAKGRFVRAIGIVQDVTERKHAEQALREQQARLLAIYQALPDAIIRVDRHGNYLDFKPPTGFIPYDIPTQTIGRHISENVPTEVATLALQYLNRLFSTGKPQQFEHTLVIDGQLRYRENRLVKLNDHEALAITRDISEQKRIELNLQIQTERLLALYQGIPDGIAVITKDGVMLESKPPRNYEPYHFTSLNMGDRLEDNAPEHVARIVREKLAALFATGEPQEYVYSLYTVGETHYREGRLVKLNDYEALSIVRDISEQKRAEEALHQSQEQLEEAQRIGRIGTWTYDIDSQKTTWSKEIYAQAGVDPTVDPTLDLIKSLFKDFTPLRTALARAIETVEPYEIELEYVTVTGEPRWVFSVGNPIVEDGRVVRLVGIQQDITERKNAENALRAEREHLYALYQAIPDTIIRLNREGVYLDYKPSTYFKPYIDPATTLGKTLFDNTPAEVAQRAHEHIEALFATGKMQQFENTLVIDGKVHHRENRWVKVGDDEVIAIVRDVSEQKRATAALQAEKEHLLRLYQAIPEQIIRFNQQGIILDYKPASDFPATTTPERAVGRSLLEVAENPAVGATTMRYVQQAFATGEVQSFEQHFVQHGEEHYRDHRMVKVSGDEAITLIRDTTEKRHAERALQESKQRLDLAIDAANLGIWDRYIDQPTATVNDNYRTILGIPNDEIITVDKVHQDIHPADVATTQADFAELYAGSKSQHSHERRQRHRDGSYRWLKVRGAVVERDAWGQPHRFVSVIQDIHEQKTLQLRLEDTLLELENALRDKDVLLAEVHHRVKNNMQVIGSIMSLHAREVGEPAAQAALLASRARIRTMAAIHEVMYNTEIFSDLEFSTYLQTIARSLVQLHYRELHQQQDRPLPHLHFDLAPVNLSLQDALPCALIFNELLSNALKHAFPEHYQGRPTITIHLQENGDNVSLSVIDNGVGSSNGNKNFGSFIVDSLVEQLQGQLEIHSTVPDMHNAQPASDNHAENHVENHADNHAANSNSNKGTTATLQFSKVLYL